MIKIINLLILVLINTVLFSQTVPDTLWTKTYGGSGWEFGRQVQQTNDGGYIIIGETESCGAGGLDVWLIKTNSTGDTLWTRTFGGIYEDRGYSVQQTTDEGYIIAGITGSFGAGHFDIWLIKTDSNGDSIWTKTFGGSGWEWSYSVKQTTDSGYIVVGCTDPTAMGYFDVFLIKTDSIGNTIWTKTYGGSSWDVGYSVKQTTDGGYIITGDTYSFGAGSRDVWLLRTDSNGDTLWTRTFGGSGSDCGNSVYQTNDGGYILTGFTKSYGSGDKDVWLIKTEDNGDTLWTRTFGGVDEECGYSVQQTTDSGYIIAGYTNDVLIIKTDINGDTVWTKTIGGVNIDAGRSIQQTTDGGYIVVGDKYIDLTVGYEIFLIKIGSESGVNSQIISEPIIFNINNYPNPFNSSTNIKFEISDRSLITIDIYNLCGQKIRNIFNQSLPFGNYNILWDGKDEKGGILPTGIYIYKIIVNNEIFSKKMSLIR